MASNHSQRDVDHVFASGGYRTQLFNDWARFTRETAIPICEPWSEQDIRAILDVLSPIEKEDANTVGMTNQEHRFASVGYKKAKNWLARGNPENAAWFIERIIDMSLNKAILREEMADAQQYRRYRQNQAERGKKGADKRWAEGEADALVNKAVLGLAKRRDELGDYLEPSELWPELYSLLEESGLELVEHNDPLRYQCQQLSKPLKYEAFRRRIQRARQ